MPFRFGVIEMVETGPGGGSIAAVDNLARIQVGPASAGSEPGPACYGRGGRDCTVTDANLLLGRLQPDRFAGGKMRLDPEAASAAAARSIGETLNLDVPSPALGGSAGAEENIAHPAPAPPLQRR